MQEGYQATEISSEITTLDEKNPEDEESLFTGKNAIHSVLLL
jgi:hypothetical protein